MSASLARKAAARKAADAGAPWGLAEFSPAPAPCPASVWQYSWTVTLTWRSLEDSPSGAATESRMLVDDLAELHRIVERASCDPRIADVHCERHAALDMAMAPTGCHVCGERFAVTRPRQWWRVCSCGGHWVYACAACGADQVYPRLEKSCP